MTTRRTALSLLGLGSVAGVAAPLAARVATQLPAADSAVPPAVPQPSADDVAPSAHAAADVPYRPVRTLNGWTLPWRMNGGVKEFHLVACELEHEFAPGTRAKCWGYNGSTPGPTIEAVEGDHVRIFVTNRLPEPTTIHWHGLLLPSGMDGVGGLSQAPIQPGETWVYEFPLVQNGTCMYHPHADELVQIAFGMMGMFIIHPRADVSAQTGQTAQRVDRDYCLLLHNWALHPGTYRPDPSIMQAFDLWTFNSKVFPAIDPMVARTGERVRVRVGNLSMWNHPVHMHGVQFEVTGSDGGRWPVDRWQREVTSIVGVGQVRDLEFVAVPGDWAFHCHMAHHTMNPMGHGLPNPVGVEQGDLAPGIAALVPGFTAMGQHGMSEHAEHLAAGHVSGPPNTLPMMMGRGPYGNLEMGGMFTVIKVRDDLAPGDFRDPGWYRPPPGTMTRRISADPDFGDPPWRAD